MLRLLLPRCEASTRLLLSGVGASGALHAIAAVMIVAVFGVLSPNLLPPPHGRNSIELTASLIVVEPTKAPPAEQPEFSVSATADFRKPDANHDTSSSPVAASVAVTVSRVVGTSARRAERSADVPPVQPTDTRMAKQPTRQTPPSAVAAPPSTANAGQLDQIPATVHSPRPEYPAAALREGIEGRVVLRVDLDRHGDVSRASVVTSSGNTGLDIAAQRAVRRWRFEPATRLGIPVATAIAVPITFRIERD